MSEPGETLVIGDASELGGMDDFISAPTTPLPVSEERIPDHPRAVSSDRGQGTRDRDAILGGNVSGDPGAQPRNGTGPDQSDRARRRKPCTPCATGRENSRS